MKELDELNLPDDLKFSNDHEWVRMEDGRIRVGISDYAQDQLGDIVYVELPEVSDTVEAGVSFGVVESVKSVSDLLSPVSGTVVAVNGELESAPELTNTDPYGEGWMMLIEPGDLSAIDTLMDVKAYLAFLEEA